MKRLSPSSFIAAASAYIGAVDDPVAGVSENFGDCLRDESGLPEDWAWDAAMVYRWGFWSHYDHIANTSSWPLPRVASAQELGVLGGQRNVLRQRPKAGDIYLLRSGRTNEFIRVGVIAAVLSTAENTLGREYHDVVAIEGDSDANGSIGGRHIVRLVRRLSEEQGDRFIRWTEAGPVEAHNEEAGQEAAA